MDIQKPWPVVPLGRLGSRESIPPVSALDELLVLKVFAPPDSALGEFRESPPLCKAHSPLLLTCSLLEVGVGGSGKFRIRTVLILRCAASGLLLSCWTWPSSQSKSASMRARSKYGFIRSSFWMERGRSVQSTEKVMGLFMLRPAKKPASLWCFPRYHCGKTKTKLLNWVNVRDNTCLNL